MIFGINGDRYLLDLEFEQAKRAAKKKRSLVSVLLKELDIVEAPRGPFSIETYLTERVETTKGHAEEVRNEMQIRAKLHSKFMKEIRSQITYAQLSLEKMSGWGVGYNTGVDVKRNHLERQLLQLRQERRATELKAWDDVVKLRKELTETMEEYRRATRLGTIQ